MRAPHTRWVAKAAHAHATTRRARRPTPARTGDNCGQRCATPALSSTANPRSGPTACLGSASQSTTRPPPRRTPYGDPAGENQPLRRRRTAPPAKPPVCRALPAAALNTDAAGATERSARVDTAARISAPAAWLQPSKQPAGRTTARSSGNSRKQQRRDGRSLHLRQLRSSTTRNLRDAKGSKLSLELLQLLLQVGLALVAKLVHLDLHGCGAPRGGGASATLERRPPTTAGHRCECCRAAPPGRVSGRAEASGSARSPRRARATWSTHGHLRRLKTDEPERARNRRNRRDVRRIRPAVTFVRESRRNRRR